MLTSGLADKNTSLYTNFAFQNKFEDCICVIGVKMLTQVLSHSYVQPETVD